MIRRFRRYLVPFLLTTILFFHAGLSIPAAQQTPTPVTLKVILYPYLSYAPYFIAEEEGYFAEQGLNIEYSKIRDDSAVQALSRGQVDVWGGLISVGVLNAMERGAHIRYVADRGYFAADGCPYFAMVARKSLVDSGELNSPAQLKGRNIAWYRASFDEYFLEKVLQKGGLKLADVKYIKIPTPAEIEAMAKGSLDLTITPEPWVSRFLKAGHGVVWMPVQKVVPDFQFGLMMYGPNLLEKNPDAGRRFMVAYLKAVRQYNQGKTPRNLEILANRTGLDKDLLIKACWAQVHSDGRINVNSIKDFKEWALTNGYLEGPVSKDLFIDTRFIEHANKVLSKTN